MSEDEEISVFENAIELVLEARPEAVLPVIHTIANELTFSDGHFYFQDTKAEGDINAGIDRCMIGVSNHKKVHSAPVGVVTLQTFPENRTLFRVPPRSKWEIGNCELDVDGSLFTIFIQRLFTEFQRLGFIDFKKEKPPIGFKPPHEDKNA